VTKIVPPEKFRIHPRLYTPQEDGDFFGFTLNMAVEDLRSKGITPIYLLSDHGGFYERYGWEFFCMAQGMMIPICQGCIFTAEANII